MLVMIGNRSGGFTDSIMTSFVGRVLRVDPVATLKRVLNPD
jgi:hypothetical protein